MVNLHAAFLQSVAAHPDKTALFWGETEFNYAHFRREAGVVTQALRESLGVRAGDRVGIWLRNRPEFVSVLFGIFGADAVAVPVNTFLKPAEVAYLLLDAGIQVLITEDALMEAVAEIQRTLPGLLLLRAEELPGRSAAMPPEFAVLPSECTPGDLAVLIYTSGTTGHPKGAMLTHGNLLSNVESCRQVLEVVDFDRFVLLLPMFHSFMLTVSILLPLLVGGSIVLIQALSHPKHMVSEMLQARGTVLPAMAALFRALAHLPPQMELPLRICVSGAGPLPHEILRAFNQRHPTVPLIEGYGLSEASPVVCVNPVCGPHHAGTIGPVIPDVEMTVQDDAGNVLPDGTDGEFCVRGPNVMLGYWNAPAKTAETLVNGWLRTGDIGHRRPDGWFVVTDRKKDMLKPNGINVYPREIEEVIYRFPGIKECAVVGEPDEKRGERAVAFVALDESAAAGFSESALIDFLKPQLADYKLPRRIVTLSALPRNATGKILKTALREQLRS